MSQRSTVVTAQTAHPRKNGVRRDLDVRCAVGLGECPLLVGDCVWARDRVDLRSEPAEPDEHARAIRPGRQHVREMLERRVHVLPPLAGRLVQIGRLHDSPRSRGCVAFGRERSRALGERRCGLRRAARVLAISRQLELQRDRVVRRLGAATEVERPLVGVVDHRCEGQVHTATLLGRVHLEKSRCEQRVREPQAPGALVDDPSGTELEDAGVVLGSGHAWIEAPEDRSSEPRRTSLVGDARDPSAKRHGKALGHPRLRISRDGELEGVVGATGGQLRYPRELRRRQRMARSLEDELREMSLRQAPDLDALQRAPGAVGETRQLEVEADPNRRDETHRRRIESTNRECESAETRRIHPLKIVNRDDERRGGGQQAEHPQGGESDRERIDRQARVAPTKRLFERTTLNPGQLSKSRVVDRCEEIGQHCEGEIGFRLGRSREQDAEVPTHGLLDDGRPDRRLADSGLTCEEQPAGALRSLCEEAIRFGDLTLPAYHDTVHAHRGTASAGGVARCRLRPIPTL